MITFRKTNKILVTEKKNIYSDGFNIFTCAGNVPPRLFSLTSLRWWCSGGDLVKFSGCSDNSDYLSLKIINISGD